MPPAEGALAVAANASNARLTVDDVPRGSSPFAPLRLTPGNHTLEVSAPRHTGWSGTVDVEDGRTTSVEVDLSSTRGIRQGWFWSFAALTLATAVTGAVLLVTGFDHENEYIRYADAIESGGASPLELAVNREAGQESLDLAQSYTTGGIVLLGTAGLCLIVTVIVGALTRFSHAEATARIVTLGEIEADSESEDGEGEEGVP